ncbi:thiamine-phosphate kinase [Actinomyces trachealis]|uniref:thiamine-phosphate kinase n=1 Tax=Actinomyces trachealis TaxID=2763540 RepID=UPI001892AD93|nr:thiamine-phosphate kinase [Actinomyces trachealis]
MDPMPAAGVHDSLPVNKVGEDALIAVLAPLLPVGGHALVGNGDDCAVVAAPDHRFCVSTDLLVEGHHFKRTWSTAQEIGARAAVQNLADVAAMGAVPTALVVGLVLPPETAVGWVRGVAQGLAEACRECGTGVLGGDLSAGEQVVISVTVHGDLQGNAPVLRSGAQPGDLLVHAGNLGISAAGLALLCSGVDDPERHGGVTTLYAARAWERLGLAGQERARAALAAYRVPVPALTLGPALAEVGAHAMMDVSDSLLRDAGRMARASGVRIDVDDPMDGAGGGWLAYCRERLEVLLPVFGDLFGHDAEAVAAGTELTASWVLTGGEDHGILAAVPASAADRLPAGVQVIGHVLEAQNGAPSVSVGGREWKGSTGWDHFH